MICPKCNFDNKDNSAFCTQCGAKMIEAPTNESIVEKDEAKSEETKIEESKSEESTTVLTSDMLNEVKSEESTTVLTTDMLTSNDRIPVNNAVPQMNQPMTGPMNQPMNQPMMNPQVKPVKPPKQPKQKSGKLGGGTIAYIVISIILILGLAGSCIWGYLHYNKKLDKLNEDNKLLNDDFDSAMIDIEEKNDEIAELEHKADELEQDNADLQTQILDYEALVSELSASSEAYEEYDYLIGFVNDVAVGQGYDDFFVSDSVLHLKEGETKTIRIFYYSEEGGVDINVEEHSVADINIHDDGWGESGYVGSVDIIAGEKGSTEISFSIPSGDEEVKMLVIVD